MDEHIMIFGFKAHKVVSDYAKLRTISSCVGWLAISTGLLTTLGCGGLSILSLAIIAWICKKCESKNWFEDSDVRFTNTLFIVNKFAGTILLQCAVYSILSVLLGA